MHWKLKAVIQNTISLLPNSVSYAAYFWIQRHFGGLRRINPVSSLTAGIATWNLIKELGYDPSEKVFFKVGTGRVPLMPLAYWLMGAKKTMTIDLNPCLKEELIKESLQYISDNSQEILKLFGSLVHQDRMDDLMHFNKNLSFSTSAFLDICHINYIAPSDAANTTLSNQSIDFHTSYVVLEHIPLEVLKNIIDGGNRIISDNGLFIHRIDYSDHFSHSDKTISSINFLQFSDNDWIRYAGNRYMYMNRLRHDDYIRLFQSAGHCILAAYPDVDEQSQELLRSESFRFNELFKSKSEDVLSIRGAWIVSQKSR
jgi:hypothetical protein